MELSWQSTIDKLYKSKSSKICQKLVDVHIYSLYDLLFILPRRVTKIHNGLNNGLCIDEFINSNVKVISKLSSPAKVSGQKFTLSNISLNVQDIESKIIFQLKWFNVYPSMSNTIMKANYLQVFGKITQFNGHLQIINPEIKINKNPQTIYREYPTINSVPGTKICELINKIPQNLWSNIPSVVGNEINLDLNLGKAFNILHFQTDVSNREKAFKRVVYEELYNEQVLLHTRKNKRLILKTEKFNINSASLIEQFQENLPFNLTTDQKSALDQIYQDLNSEIPMMRLLQGDVGCGKTLVALGAAFALMKQNVQIALMCPTEVLAQQHYKSAIKIFKETQVTLLTSSTKNKDKLEIYEGIQNGEILLIIGTHSLIQDSLIFKSLALAIIDEQHKFGVNQRIALTKKSIASNTLLMTATPIPRSLCLTQFGDLDISIIREKPAGRKKISSRIVSEENFQNFLNFINTRLNMGEQIYVVAPAIEESELLDIQNVEKIYAFFKKNFPNREIETLHGKKGIEEKDFILTNFYSQKTNILISTSVIEVGIDNHNATVMCIFGPERFGLSSLHQLRGRVGRGEKPGFFFMVEDKKLTGQSLKRLKVIENCADGFKIAEEDLKIRGEGNLIGTEQSGTNLRKISDLVIHKDILEKVINDFNKSLLKPNLFNSQSLNQEVIYTI